MSRFIELHLKNDNQPVLVNIALIISMASYDIGTKILLQGGYTVIVTESYQQIKKKLKVYYGTTI